MHCYDLIICSTIKMFKTVPFLFRDIFRISRDLWRCIYDSPTIKMDFRSCW